MLEASRLAFDPLIPWWALWTLAAFAAALWAAYVALRGRARLFRALALTILALAVANPLWINEEREPLKDIVALVVDRSESMQFRGRSEAADAALEQLRAAIEADETLELRIAETDPAADGSDVHSALQAALADAPRERIAGAVMITDGQIHDLPEDPARSAALGPVHGLIVGGQGEVDRRIAILAAPSFAIVDQEVELAVLAEDPEADRIDVEVSVNGERQGVRSIRTGERQTIGVELPRRGSNLIVLETAPIDGELTLANNLASAAMSGVRDRLRVLLVTGEPHAGARVWRDLLKSDPSVDLVHFTILRPPSKHESATQEELALIAFPKRELFVEKLSQFDLVIFDHELRREVLEWEYLDNIARYVERGGGLLVAAGPIYDEAQNLYRTPLAAVLPGEGTGRSIAQTFVPQLTDLGRRHAVTAGLPAGGQWGPWLRYMELTGGEGEALMATPEGAPLLILDRVGEGRIANFLSDQIWLWARGYGGGGPYAELIRRSAHWLMKEPELEEELLELTTAGPEIAARLRSLSDAPPPLSLTAPSGATSEVGWTQVGPGDYQARLPAPDLGLYRGTSGELDAVVLRGPEHPREYADVEATEELLRPVAEAGGGSVRRIGSGASPAVPVLRRVGENSDAAGSGWIGLKRREAYAVRSTQSQMLLPGPVGMALAVAFMMLAWRREGR
jgi:hypothetical protein